MHDVTDRVMKKYWYVKEKDQRKLVLDYIAKNKPKAQIRVDPNNLHEVEAAKVPIIKLDDIEVKPRDRNVSMAV